MTAQEAKEIIRSLKLTGKEFSELLGANTNYVSNFSRDGVPRNVAIFLDMAVLLKNNGISNEIIIEIISKHVNTNN